MASALLDKEFIWAVKAERHWMSSMTGETFRYSASDHEITGSESVAGLSSLV